MVIKRFSMMMVITLIFTSLLSFQTVFAAAAKMKVNTSVIGGPATSFVTIGSVSANESVNVLESDGMYYFIEYSTSSGNKRGYVPASSVTVTGSILAASYAINKKCSISSTVSSATLKFGPGSNYASVVYNSANVYLYPYANVTVLRQEGAYYFIEFDASYPDGKRRCYVSTTSVDLNTNPEYSRPIQSGTKTSSHSGSHSGVDIGTSGASPAVYAMDAGTVTYKIAYKKTTTGNKYVSYGIHAIVSVSGKKMTLYYCHLSKLANGFSAPSYSSIQESAGSDTITETIGTATLTKGQLIGYVGSTGNSSGNHLHFECRINGISRDPYNYVRFP